MAGLVRPATPWFAAEKGVDYWGKPGDDECVGIEAKSSSSV